MACFGALKVNCGFRRELTNLALVAESLVCGHSESDHSDVETTGFSIPLVAAVKEEPKVCSQCRCDVATVSYI